MTDSTQATDQSQSQIIAYQCHQGKRLTNRDRQYTSHRPESVTDQSLPVIQRETANKTWQTVHKPQTSESQIIAYQWHQEKRQTNHDRQYTSHRPESITRHSLPMTPREKAYKPWQTVHKPQTRVSHRSKPTNDTTRNGKQTMIDSTQAIHLSVTDHSQPNDTKRKGKQPMTDSTQASDQSQSQIIAYQWHQEKRQTTHDRQYTSHRPESVTDHSYQWHHQKRQTNHDR